MKKDKIEKVECKELSGLKIILMTFAPPLIVIIVYIFALQLRNVIPPLLSFIIIALFILVPIELAVLMYANKKEFGEIGLKCGFKYNSKVKAWKIVLELFILLCIAGLMAKIVGGFENALFMPLINRYVPDYFIVENFIYQLSSYPVWMIHMTAILFVIANGFILPIVEELYFRGYMMARIERYGKIAPLIITLLFSLYHFWSPWQNLRRICGIFPYTFAVWKEKKILIGILVHCAANLIGSVEFLMMVFK